MNLSDLKDGSKFNLGDDVILKNMFDSGCLDRSEVDFIFFYNCQNYPDYLALTWITQNPDGQIDFE